MKPAASAPERPSTRRWSWTQFVCVFLFAGMVSFLRLEVWALSLAAHLCKTLLVATACGFLAGRFGDSALGFVTIILWFL